MKSGNDEDILKNVVVLIPTLNEEEAIGYVIDELLQCGVGKEQILVVDGGSTDKTRDIVMSKGVKVIIQEGKGKADAIATAVKYIDKPYVLVMDGDYTYPAKYVKELLKKAIEGNYDEVIGAREKKIGMSVTYRFGNWILTKAFNLMFGTKLKDVLSGMYVVKTKVLKEIEWGVKGFSIEAEIAAHAASIGKISEYPISYRKRLGEKKLKVIHGFQIARDIVKLMWRYNPAFFIFLAGSLTLLPGLVLGAWVAYHYLLFGIKYYVKGLIAIILTVAGFQSLLMAVLTLYLKRMEIRLRKVVEVTAHKGST